MYRDLREYLSKVTLTNKLDKLNACAHIFKLIVSYKETSEGAFEYFLTHGDELTENSTNSLAPHKFYGKDQLEQLTEEYGQYIDSIFELLLKQNLEASVFYRKLWDKIQNDSFLESEMSKICGLM